MKHMANKNIMAALLLVFGLQASWLSAQTAPPPTKPPTTKPSTLPSSATKRTTTRRPDFPPASIVMSGFTQVIPVGEKKQSMWNIYVRKKDNQMYGELPPSYASQRYFFALTISSGDLFAGLHYRERLVYWR